MRVRPPYGGLTPGVWEALSLRPVEAVPGGLVLGAGGEAVLAEVIGDAPVGGVGFLFSAECFVGLGKAEDDQP